jgi:hypothetical protein
MPPVVKIAQVFMLIIGRYAVSYYMLAVRKSGICRPFMDGEEVKFY